MSSEPETTVRVDETVEISYLIVNWNGGEVVRSCIESILADVRNAGLTSWEIVIVDNASDDFDETEFLDNQRIRIYRNTSNLGFAIGTNQSVEIARGDYLFILNNDVLLEPGCTADLLKPIVEKRADATAPRFSYPNGRLQKSISGLPSIRDVVVKFSGAGLLFPSFDHWSNPRFDYEVPSIVVHQPLFSAFLTTRATWTLVGGIDERFPLFWNDVDWFHRFHQHSLICQFVPHARVVHHHGMSTKKMLFSRIIQTTSSMVLYFRKHFHLSFQDNLLLQLARILGLLSGFTLDCVTLLRNILRKLSNYKELN